MEICIPESPRDRSHSLVDPSATRIIFAYICTAAITHQGVIATDSHRQFTILCMPANHLRHRLGDLGHQAGILEDADGGVAGGGDFFELVVSVELDEPSEVFELVDEAGVDEVDGALIDAFFGLCCVCV